MPGHDDHDLERRLREQRPVARDEFVQGLAGQVRDSRSHPTARPRLTLAFALSLAMLVSLVAFGGVGAAKDAVSASTSTIKSAWGGDSHKSRGGKGDDGDGSPAHHQYHPKVTICFPHTSYTVTYKIVTITRVIYKWKHVKVRRDGHWRWIKVKVPVTITYEKKIRVKTKTTVYDEKTVSQSAVPYLTAKGAIYPVPTAGCSSLNPTASA